MLVSSCQAPILPRAGQQRPLQKKGGVSCRCALVTLTYFCEYFSPSSHSPHDL
jgi:hypothetical protein